jgi:hypothetical protein
MQTSSPITWSGPDHEHQTKTSDWYWALGTIAVSCAVTAMIFGNILFAVLILAAATTLGIVASREPRIVEFVLNEKGLLAGDTFHSFDEIQAFWVDTEREEPVLLIDTTRVMTPHLFIPLNHVDPEDIRSFLSRRVPEEYLQEPFSHKLFEFFGF